MKQKRSVYWWASFSLIVVFFVIAAVYFFSKTLVIQGDGHEYVLQTVSFQNHFTFGINDDDLEQATEQFYNNEPGLRSVYNRLAVDDQGLHYSNHFGAYSVLVTPIKMLLLALGQYPLRAFGITNWLLWLAAALTVLFFLKTDDKKRLCLICLLLFNPVFFYLDWVHTEVYIFSFVVIGLVFFYNKNYSVSIIALSAAAMQNLAVIPMAAMVGIDYIIECISRYKAEKNKFSLWGFVKSYWKRIIPYGAYYLIAFIPMITTYMHFGTLNLVADVAMESKYIFHKAIDYLIDPNIGILPYEPIIFVLFFVLIIIGMKKNTRSAIINLIGFAGMLFIIAHQRQINCGMYCIMRYCVWILPVMLFYVVMNWNICFNDKGLLVAGGVQSIFTFGVLSYCMIGGGMYTSNQFADWTKVVLDYCPELYNPSHGIFYSRTLGNEKYYSHYPVIYRNEDGKARKILLSKTAEEYFYSDQTILFNEDTGEIVNKNELDRFSFDEGEFTYINLHGNILYYNLLRSSGDSIRFTLAGNNTEIYPITGLAQMEEWGTWTNGDEFSVNFCTDSDEEYLVCDIDINNVFYHPQRVNVFINDEMVHSDTIAGNQDFSFMFKNPENGMVKLRMELPDSISPAEVMDSPDKRDLGLGLVSMSLLPISESDKAYNVEDVIYFYSDEYNADKYAVSGLSVKEEWGSWTDGDEMLMNFHINDDAERLVCYIDVVRTFYQAQNVDIFINDELVYSEKIDGDNDIEFEFKRPEDGVVNLKIELPDSVSPSEIMDSADKRDLGLGLASMVIAS